jgi:uncharacterized damage-inducible protein DinB
MRFQVVDPLNGYTLQVGVWLWAFENSRKRTHRVLKEFNPGLLEWVPTWGGNSISTLLYHLAAIEVDWLFTDILEKEPFPPEIEALFPHDVRLPNGHLTPIEGEPLNDHLQRLVVVRSYFLNSFREISDDDFLRVRSFSDYDVTPQWTIHHLMQHEAEHRGQIMAIKESFQHDIYDG